MITPTRFSPAVPSFAHLLRPKANAPVLRSSHQPSRTDPSWTSVENLPENLRFSVRSPRDAALARHLVNEIFHQEVYARPGFDFPGDGTVLDIGANMGIFSQWAAKRVPNGRILAVEPTRIFETLEHNIAQNGLSQVTAVRKAMGVDGHNVELDFYPSAHPGSLQVGFHNRRFTFCVGRMFPRLKRCLFPSHPVFAPPERDVAPGISLPRLLEEYDLRHVDFMKMDCEGAEFIVFKDLRPRDLLPFDKMVIEFHEYRRDFDHRRIVEFLRHSGFSVEVRRPLTFRLFQQGYIWAKRPSIPKREMERKAQIPR